MTMDTETRCGLEMWLLVASQVSDAPSSDLERLETTTVEVTVLPEETSDEEGSRPPLPSHTTDGRGRPEKKNNLHNYAMGIGKVRNCCKVVCKFFDYKIRRIEPLNVYPFPRLRLKYTEQP